MWLVSVEKRFAMWNVIQNVLLTLKPNTYCFCFKQNYQHSLKFLHILATSL